MLRVLDYANQLRRGLSVMCQHADLPELNTEYLMDLQRTHEVLQVINQSLGLLDLLQRKLRKRSLVMQKLPFICITLIAQFLPCNEVYLTLTQLCKKWNASLCSLVSHSILPSRYHRVKRGKVPKRKDIEHPSRSFTWMRNMCSWSWDNKRILLHGCINNDPFCNYQVVDLKTGQSVSTFRATLPCNRLKPMKRCMNNQGLFVALSHGFLDPIESSDSEDDDASAVPLLPFGFVKIPKAGETPGKMVLTQEVLLERKYRFPGLPKQNLRPLSVCNVKQFVTDDYLFLAMLAKDETWVYVYRLCLKNRQVAWQLLPISAPKKLMPLIGWDIYINSKDQSSMLLCRTHIDSWSREMQILQLNVQNPSLTNPNKLVLEVKHQRSVPCSFISSIVTQFYLWTDVGFFMSFFTSTDERQKFQLLDVSTGEWIYKVVLPNFGKSLLFPLSPTLLTQCRWDSSGRGSGSLQWCQWNINDKQQIAKVVPVDRKTSDKSVSPS